jgi:hypothetical protein
LNCYYSDTAEDLVIPVRADVRPTLRTVLIRSSSFINDDNRRLAVSRLAECMVRAMEPEDLRFLLKELNNAS